MGFNIVIYSDEGAGEFGLSCLQSFFAGDSVRLCKAPDLIEGSIFDDTDIFVMPGGADLPYCKKLNGKGNRNIRTFVKNGGTYLGICAGAYYACASIEYHKGRNDEICEPRELALIDAIAIGSIPEIAIPYDLTLESAGIAPLKSPDTQSYYHGGPYFQLNDPSAKVLAYYDLPYESPAIVSKRIGKGSVILSGVHFETTPSHLKTHPENPDQGEQLANGLIDTIDWREFLFKRDERQ